MADVVGGSQSPRADGIVEKKRRHYEDAEVGCKDDAEDFPADAFPLILYSLVASRTHPTTFNYPEERRSPLVAIIDHRPSFLNPYLDVG